MALSFCLGQKSKQRSATALAYFGTAEADANSSKSLRLIDLFIIIEEMPARSYLGDFELMILLALMRLGHNAYGVPISREIEEQSGREIAVGSVYAALERLERRGLVSSHLGKPTAERGGKAKRYFRITPNGLRKARETRHALMKLWRGLPELEGASS